MKRQGLYHLKSVDRPTMNNFKDGTKPVQESDGWVQFFISKAC